MVEKWMQSKPSVNPWLSPRRATKVRQVRQVRPRVRVPMKTIRAHFGTPIQLFKDSDKDGVANVFDCKPYSKKKQDVIHPPYGGSSPMMEMYARQNAIRQQRAYKKQMEDYQRLEEQRLAELQRIQGETQYVSGGTVYVENPIIYSGAEGKFVSYDTKSGQAAAKEQVAAKTPTKFVAKVTYTGKQAKNIMTTGDPNKSGKVSPIAVVVSKAKSVINVVKAMKAKASGVGR